MKVFQEENTTSFYRELKKEKPTRTKNSNLYFSSKDLEMLSKAGKVRKHHELHSTTEENEA